MDWKKGIEVTLDPFGNPVGGLTHESIQPWMQDKAFVLVDDLETLDHIVSQAVDAGTVVIDIESQGLDTRVYNGRPNHHIVGFALCYGPDVGFYVPVRHVSAHDVVGHPDNGNLPADEVFSRINTLLTKCVTVYHNSNFDLEIMWAEGLEVPDNPEVWRRFDDTQIMGWLIDSNRKRIGLKAMSKDILGWKMIEIKDLFPKGTKDIRFEDLHPQESYIYASSDAICTWNLWNRFKDDEILAKQGFIHKLERMLVPVLRRMQRNQVLIDVEYLAELDQELEAQCNQYVGEIRRLCDDPTLNIDSPKQLGGVLFDKLSIPNAGKTGSGAQWKTDRQSLEDLDSKHEGKYPALSMVVKYRQLQKLRGTYVCNLMTNLDDQNQGRFGIQACGAPTGRFAAPGGKTDQGYTGVNAQAVPKVKKDKPNIRRAFIARPGYIIVAVDFAGVELRIAGNISREQKWIDEFTHADCVKKWGNDCEVIGDTLLWHFCPYCHKKVGDIHSQTSQAVFGTAEEPYRGRSKGVNFGILYGAGGKTLARNIGVSEDDGYRIQRSFLESLPTLSRWIKKQHRVAKNQKWVRTAFGRIRLIPEMDSENRGEVAFGQRTAVNTQVQGASADITKIAMVGCDKLIRSRGWEEDCRLLLTVHDEIVFEVRESKKDVILPALAETMCKTKPKHWEIPLTVDVEYGPSWGEVTNEWKPQPPRLKALRPDVQPLHPGDLFYDGTVLEEDGARGEVVDEEGIDLADSGEGPIEGETVPADTDSDSEEVDQVDADTEDSESIYVHVLKRPYTRSKWKKAEALFILTEGKTKLRLISESGQNLTGSRSIYVDPVYFKYKAEEWGL